MKSAAKSFHSTVLPYDPVSQLDQENVQWQQELYDFQNRWGGNLTYKQFVAFVKSKPEGWGWKPRPNETKEDNMWGGINQHGNIEYVPRATPGASSR